MVMKCHNVTDSILRHLRKGNRVTYVKVADNIVKNHIHFYLENCSSEYKKLWVCRSLDGQLKNAIPYGQLSKDLYSKIEKVLVEIIRGKYVCDIVSTRYNLLYDRISKKYFIVPEIQVQQIKKDANDKVVIMRYLSLEELLDKTTCDRIIATGDDDVPLF